MCRRPVYRALLATVTLALLGACGGGGQGGMPPAPTTTYLVGGVVAGLGGSGLSLQLNGGANLAVVANGGFSFPAGLAKGLNYQVSVLTQPAAPAQGCVVQNGTGTIGTAAVTDVTVSCNASPFTTPTNQPPVSGYLALLLTDGGVMMQSNADAGVFYKLTPDLNGSYANGSWRQLARPPLGYAPYAGAQAVLADGRVLFVGGEYNNNQYALPFAPSGLTNESAIYDPVADTWTMLAPPAGVDYIGDAPSAVMPDGSFVFGTKLGRAMVRLDPVSLDWAPIPASGKADNFAEEGFTLLPNGQLFTIDVGNGLHAEHYDPVAGMWYSDGNVPASLTSPTDFPGGLGYGPAPARIVGGVSYGPGPTGTYLPPGETGPAILMNDGRVFATGSAVSGATGHTALYTPGLVTANPGSFTAGPDFKAGDNAGDASAALLPNGHVIVTTPSGRFYEFDGTAMNVTAALPSNGGSTLYFILPLPNGQALVTGGVTQLYTASGGANPAWAPTITSAPTSVTRGASYAISGTQFNGLSQAASVGDELTASTNYPLVRITNTASGHVFYARTHDHGTMAVATGSAIVNTHFDVPAAAEVGASSLVVVANGIASTPVSVLVN
jgi:hypothetical protein